MTEVASQSPHTAAQTPAQKLGGQGTFIWAILGVTILLLQAQLRLGQIAWEALSSGTLTPFQLGVCAVWTAMNGYMEGYRGFHLRFVPRVVARAHHLAVSEPGFPKLLGPIYAMAYVRAAKKAKYAAWGVTIAVVIAIVVVRRLPQPWRGIIDAGVVTGLGLGTLSLLAAAAKRILGHIPPGSPDLPAKKADPSPN